MRTERECMLNLRRLLSCWVDQPDDKLFNAECIKLNEILKSRPDDREIMYTCIVEVMSKIGLLDEELEEFICDDRTGEKQKV